MKQGLGPCNGTLQWHHVHCTLQWHPGATSNPPKWFVALPPIGSKNPYSYRYLGTMLCTVFFPFPFFAKISSVLLKHKFLNDPCDRRKATKRQKKKHMQKSGANPEGFGRWLWFGSHFKSFLVQGLIEHLVFSALLIAFSLVRGPAVEKSSPRKHTFHLQSENGLQVLAIFRMN